MHTYSASFGKDYYRRLCTNRSPHSNHPVSKDWWNTLHHSSSMRCFGSHLLNKLCRRYCSCLHRWPARIRSRLRYCRRNLHNQLRTAGNCKYLANNSPNQRVPAHTLCRMHRNCLWYARQRSGLHEHWFRSRQPLIFHRSRHSVWFYLLQYSPALHCVSQFPQCCASFIKSPHQLSHLSWVQVFCSLFLPESSEQPQNRVAAIKIGKTRRIRWVNLRRFV